MLRRILSSKKAVTLIELILVMSLIGMVITGAFSVLKFGITAHRMGVNEYEIQASTRLTAEYINSITKNASAVFTIPESSFKETKLTNGWDYIGILDGAVVQFAYEQQNGVWGHQKKVIAPASDKVEYIITFDKVANDHDEKIIGFTIIGIVEGEELQYDENGNPKGHITIISQSESLNSLQVVHKGDGTENATAVAYRTGQREDPVLEILKPIAQVALVLDTSGSMAWSMSGGSSSIAEKDRRITKLKASSKKLVNNFAASDYPVYVSMIPFSTDANNPKPFYNVDTHASTLEGIIDGLNAVGGTNTGDGIRRGYYNITKNRTNVVFENRNVSDYLIILVDGVSTYGSVIRSNSDDFYTNDENVSSDQIKGKGSELDDKYGKGYVNIMGSKVIGDGKIKTYIIGFANSSNTNTQNEFKQNLNYIGQKTGAERTTLGDYYYLAGNEDELDIIFGAIQREILNDLWYIDGPQIVK